MALKYGKKKKRYNTVFYTIITALLICLVFLIMVGCIYKYEEDEAYENLHLQTKHIKDDLTLQMHSDRENLQTMANFAAKLYTDGESYDIILESFKPIGLIANIGILKPDNTFVTKAGELDLSGAISFEEEAKRGEYLSGRVKDLIKDDLEIVRTAVPIVANDETVGILYGVVKLEGLDDKYGKMAEELNAQLFVYGKESGDFIIDSVRDRLSNVSELKNRTYTGGFSYEQMMASDKGYTSFISAHSGKELYVHYSYIEDMGWTIMLARPVSQVFAQARIILKLLAFTFILLVLIISFYFAKLIHNERRRSAVTKHASSERKLLLEINQQQNNITAALKEIAEFSKSHSAVFFDEDGEDHCYALPTRLGEVLTGDDKKYFIAEILRYAAEFHKFNMTTVGYMCITPNSHLIKTNPNFYKFLKEHKIREISFATVIDKNNHIGILGVLNPKNSKATRFLLEDIAVCFSIAIYNKKHLSRTEIAATTDSLTGVSNRVSYNRDILMFDERKPENFSCIYIDVNELHLRNNKYGHAAGDEMLLYIANTLKDVFFGHKIYRMGGDEFVLFTENVEPERVAKKINLFMEQLKLKNYNVAIGISHRTQNTNTDEMLREAEIRMYEAKAQYYQNKEQKSVSQTENTSYVHIKTGILEIDAVLSVLKEHYNGIYRVSLDTDKAHRILMPTYLGYNESESHFSELYKKYIKNMVHPDFHRIMTSFLNFDALKRQLSEGKTPRSTYKKSNGESVVLSIYKLNEEDDSISETLWVFAKE